MGNAPNNENKEELIQFFFLSFPFPAVKKLY